VEKELPGPMEERGKMIWLRENDWEKERGKKSHRAMAGSCTRKPQMVSEKLWAERKRRGAIPTGMTFSSDGGKRGGRAQRGGGAEGTL